jgi:hypothetical protein
MHAFGCVITFLFPSEVQHKSSGVFRGAIVRPPPWPDHEFFDELISRSF